MSLTNQQQETQVILELIKERDLWKAEAERWRAIKETGWQPIETAPKDGTHILVLDFSYLKNYTPKDQYCPHRVVFWDGGGWSLSVFGDCRTEAPTHWQPLPSAP